MPSPPAPWTFIPGPPTYGPDGSLTRGVTAEKLNDESQNKADWTTVQGQTTPFDGYGAVGNGTTDDTTALSAAIADAATKGLRLHLPAGFTFLISRPLTIPANSCLQIDATVFQAALSNCNMIVIGGSNIRIEGNNLGVLNGNKANQTPGNQQAGICTVYPSNSGLNYPAAQSGLYNNVRITGLTITGFNNWPVNLALAHSVVENCPLQNSGNSAELTHSLNSHIRFCPVSGIADDGIGLYGSNYFCTIEGCYVTGCQTGAFILSDAAQPGPNIGCGLINNRITGCTDSGIYVNGDLGSGSVALQLGVRILGNICWDNQSAGGNFLLKDMKSFVISGNIGYADEASVGGILLQGTLLYGIVTGNTLNGVNANGIIVSGDPATGNAGLVIGPNVIFDTGGAGVGIALQCTGSSAYVTVRNVSFIGTFGIYFVDTSATQAANFEGANGQDLASGTHLFSQNVTIGTGIVFNATTGQATFSGLVVDEALTVTTNITAGGLTVNGDGGTGGNFSMGTSKSPGAAVLLFANIPTADPHVVGEVWKNGTVLNISAG